MNIKDFRDKLSNKLTKSNVKTFFRKQGLYVLIFLCVVAAGVTALITWPREAPLPEENADASKIDSPRLKDEIAVNPTPTPLPVPTQTPAPTEALKPASGSSRIVLKRPVEGQIIKSFSGNELVPFPSLDMWKTHNGVDIKADKDAVVVAALSGTVTEVYTNEADGGVIVISHSEKSKTLYAGLGEMLVEPGNRVNTGDQIGKIGEMPKELDLSYHLHFEYIVNGAYKDPVKYFK